MVVDGRLAGVRSMNPGDRVVGEDGQEFVLGALIAYQGKEDCHDPRCAQRHPYPGHCGGYHCPTCHEPCSMMGHARCRP